MPRATVLAVDVDLRNALAALLHEEGYRVLLAASGREALAYQQDPSTQPDFLLLDLVHD